MPTPAEKPHLEVDVEAAERWCRLIWGERQGYAQTARRYASGAITNQAYDWPGQRDELLAGLLAEALISDIYVCPLLRTAENRRQADSAPLMGRHAWMDADGWDAERHASLLSGGHEVLAVASGGDASHQHLYVDLGRDLPGEDVAELSRRLSVAFDTDNFGGNNKLLRLPGTFNHKARASGGSSGSVRWLT